MRVWCNDGSRRVEDEDTGGSVDSVYKFSRNAAISLYWLGTMRSDIFDC